MQDESFSFEAMEENEHNNIIHYFSTVGPLY